MPNKVSPIFDPQAFLATINRGRTVTIHRKNGVIFRQTAAADASSTGASAGSLAALRPDRAVMPKAVKRACFSGGGSAKNAVSVALAPGQPPSM